MKLKGEKLEVVDETKLLGTIITKDLKWNKNTQMIVKNANAKMRMLHIASKFVSNKQDLLHLYKTFVRSRLEYSCVIWHSSLTQNNINDIERIQKSAVKMILKSEYRDYDSALKTLNIESLYNRREKLCLSFAKKCLKVENMKKLFPLKQKKHSMMKRKNEKYLLNNVNTERYKRSAIPFMKELLSKEELTIKSALKSVSNGTREHCFFNSISVKI